MKQLKYVLILLGLPFLFTGCGKTDSTNYGSYEKMVKAKEKEVSFVSVSDLQAQITSHTTGIKIVDVRETEEFETGHIPGAISIPRGLLEFSDKMSNRRDVVYLYSDNQNRAVLSAKSLKTLKYKHIYVLNGGWEKWHAAYPDLTEEGSEGGAPAAAAPKASSGGCGG